MPLVRRSGLSVTVRRTRIKALQKFFTPKTVAIIGASATPGNVGNILFRNFISGKFKGRAYPVNPKYKEILGRKCYKSVKELPEKIDLAVIAIPAPAVPKVVRECAEVGIKNIVILSGGFKETGPEGAKLEEEVVRIARENNIKIIGPNCVGIYDSRSGVDTLFLPTTRLRRAKPGGLAFLSQSGAFLASIMDLAAAIDIGFSKAVSYGNKCDVDEADLIEYLLYDEDTQVIAAYIEGLDPGEGKKFMEVISRVVAHKPVIIVKGGKSRMGGKAAASHTGSLAGSYRIFKAALKQAGAIEVKGFQEMFDVVKALANQPLMRGNRLFILTNGGGLGVMMADAADENGFEVPELSEDLQRKLRERFPPYFITHNPVDVTANGTAEHYGYALDVVLPSGEVDGVVVGILFQTPALGIEVVDNLIMAKRFGKPIVVVSIGGELSRQISKMLEVEGIPVYESPERAIRALATLRDYARIKEKFGGGSS